MLWWFCDRADARYLLSFLRRTDAYETTYKPSGLVLPHKSFSNASHIRAFFIPEFLFGGSFKNVFIYELGPSVPKDIDVAAGGPGEPPHRR